jgi:hypothetical protein
MVVWCKGQGPKGQGSIVKGSRLRVEGQRAITRTIITIATTISIIGSRVKGQVPNDQGLRVKNHFGSACMVVWCKGQGSKGKRAKGARVEG